jgi:hypothetical protein
MPRPVTRPASAPAAVLALAGAAILASAALHGLVNVPHLVEDLGEVGVRATVMRPVTLVLYFSVVAMAAFGALVLHGAASALRGAASRPPALWVVAASYVAFGLGAYALVGRSPHFLGYAGMGVLVALGAAAWPRREHPAHPLGAA